MEISGVRKTSVLAGTPWPRLPTCSATGLRRPRGSFLPVSCARSRTAVHAASCPNGWTSTSPNAPPNRRRHQHERPDSRERRRLHLSVQERLCCLCLGNDACRDTEAQVRLRQDEGSCAREV